MLWMGGNYNNARPINSEGKKVEHGPRELHYIHLWRACGICRHNIEIDMKEKGLLYPVKVKTTQEGTLELS